MDKSEISSSVRDMIFKYAARLAELQSQRSTPVPLPTSAPTEERSTTKKIVKVVTPIHKDVTLEDAHEFMRTINHQANGEAERHKYEIQGIQQFTGTYSHTDPHGIQLDTARRKARAMIQAARFPAPPPSPSITLKGYVAGTYDGLKVQVDNLLAQRKISVELIAKYFHADDQVNLGLEQLRLEQINKSLNKLGY